MTAERAIDVAYRDELHVRPVDRALAAVAAQQHGVIGRAQLLRLGQTPQQIGRRVAAGRLHLLHRGVYAVGHEALTQKSRWMAAVPVGEDAVLSHRSAAALWGFRQSPMLEATAPRHVRRPGITVHRATIRPDERITHDGIPVTTVARTLLDLAAVLPARQLERAVHEAEVARLAGPLSVHDLLTRHRGRRGAARLRAVLDEPLPLPSRDVAWHDLDEAIARAGLPAPQRNVQILGYECDRVWPEHRLILELDGRAVHDTARRFETDRERDRALAAHGWHTVRVTRRQAREDRDAVLTDLASLLRPPAPGR